MNVKKNVVVIQWGKRGVVQVLQNDEDFKNLTKSGDEVF